MSGELAEIALDLEKVQETVHRAERYVHGHDQADAARMLAEATRYSALRTALEQGDAALERVIRRLREMADVPPVAGPPLYRDQGPI